MILGLLLNGHLPLLQELSKEELDNIPICNLSKTIHNKWLQAFGKRGVDLYVATCNDWICTFTQMMNYWVYLNSGSSGFGPSQHDLKLKRELTSIDGKKN